MKHTDSHIQTTFVDLERKIAAIAQVDSSLNSTSTQEQVMISVWLLYLIAHTSKAVDLGLCIRMRSL